METKIKETINMPVNKSFDLGLPKGSYKNAIIAIVVLSLLVVVFIAIGNEKNMTEEEAFFSTTTISEMEAGSYIAIPSIPISRRINTEGHNSEVENILLGEGISVENLRNNGKTASGTIANYGTIQQDIGILSLLYTQSGNNLAVGYIGDFSKGYIEHVVLEPGEIMKFEIPLLWDPNIPNHNSEEITTSLRTNSILSRF